MKSSINTLLAALALSLLFTHCEKDESGEDEMNLSFSSGQGLISENTTVPGDTTVTIKIEAETEKVNDPLERFFIEERINEAAAVEIFSATGIDQTSYAYELHYTVADSVSGNIHQLLFTIINKDGLTLQRDIKLTVE